MCGGRRARQTPPTRDSDAARMATVEDTPQPYSSIVNLIVGAAFLIGLQYAPPGAIWGVLGLIVFPYLVYVIAKAVAARMTWTPWRLFRAKQNVGGLFVAFCVWQVAQKAQQTSHVDCVQGVGGRDPECVEWGRVAGGDLDALSLVIGGAVLWWIARLKKPPLSELPVGSQESRDIED
jgi:hypothetical protein